ncbi:MAG TPA: outer membrane lipoprotein-sorting protein [Bryobacteraceae bacterium]|jgi:outer membrane lipoprotein-sorting protein|nr:outer membrane lipoprotein-sorting protein [Bryobacteraceae bacterium]
MSKLLAFLIATCAMAQDPRQIIEEVQRRNRSQSQRYEGTLTVTSAKSRVAEKRWRFERIGSFGDSKSVLRFIDPPEVKGVALLIHNHKDRSSDQWMWTPELQRDRRIALQDRSTRFFGTDFSFEDLEERDVDQFDFKLLGEEKLEGEDCWKLESRPRQTKTSQYTHSYVWVRKDLFLFMMVEGYKGGELMRRIAYRDYQNVKGLWTAKTMEVFDNKRNSRTTMKLEKLDYNLPMKDGDFTLQALRRPL